MRKDSDPVASLDPVRQAFASAVAQLDPRALREALARGADPDWARDGHRPGRRPGGDSALLSLFAHPDPKSFELAQILAQAGGALEAPRGSERRHALFQACSARAGAPLEKIQFLLDQGVDPNLLDEQSQSAAHISAWSGSKAPLSGLIIAALFEAGARVSEPDEIGNTPMDLAIDSGNAAAIAALWRLGARPDHARWEMKAGLMPSAEPFWREAQNLFSVLEERQALGEALIDPAPARPPKSL